MSLFNSWNCNLLFFFVSPYFILFFIQSGLKNDEDKDSDKESKLTKGRAATQAQIQATGLFTAPLSYFVQ